MNWLVIERQTPRLRELSIKLDGFEGVRDEFHPSISMGSIGVRLYPLAMLIYVGRLWEAVWVRRMVGVESYIQRWRWRYLVIIVVSHGRRWWRRCLLLVP